MTDNQIQIRNFVAQYRELAIQHRDGTREGRQRKTNQAYDKLTKLFRMLQNDDSLAENTLPILLCDDDVKVRTLAAAHSLGLKKYVSEAQNILEETARIKELGLLSFNAKMTMEVWKKQGYLRF